jgi:hypothetical protein
MRRLLILATAVALLVTACKIETNVEATLNADGTGTVLYEIGLDDEAEGLLLQNVDPFEDVPEGAATRTEERGDMTYYIASLSFADAADLTGLMTEEESAVFSTFTATFSETKVTVRGTTQDTGGGLLGDSELEGFDPGLIEESVSATVRIRMPGKVLESNADSADGNTLSWQVPLFGSPIEVRAESDPTQSGGGGGGFPAWLIVVIVLVLAAGVAYFVLNQRRSAPATAPGSMEIGGPAGGEPPPPPPPPPVE